MKTEKEKLVEFVEMFMKINEDCLITGESVVPITRDNADYYENQLSEDTDFDIQEIDAFLAWLEEMNTSIDVLKWLICQEIDSSRHLFEKLEEKTENIRKWVKQIEGNFEDQITSRNLCEQVSSAKWKLIWLAENY